MPQSTQLAEPRPWLRKETPRSFRNVKALPPTRLLLPPFPPSLPARLSPATAQEPEAPCCPRAATPRTGSPKGQKEQAKTHGEATARGMPGERPELSTSLSGRKEPSWHISPEPFSRRGGRPAPHLAAQQWGHTGCAQTSGFAPPAVSSERSSLPAAGAGAVRQVPRLGVQLPPEAARATGRPGTAGSPPLSLEL